MDSIDEEWKEIAKQINMRLEEAGHSLNQIKALKDKAGIKYLECGANDYFSNQPNRPTNAEIDELELKLGDINLHPLEVGLYNAGWRSSSQLC